MDDRCRVCRGLCCTKLALAVDDPDVHRWLSFHGDQTSEKWIEFPCRCRKLVNGKCSIYEDRPKICKDLEVGSNECLFIVKRYGSLKIKKMLGLI